MKEQILSDISKLIDQAISISTPQDRQATPFVDPFNADHIIQRPELPAPGIGQTRFYYYYHRSSGNMMLRFGASNYEIAPDALTIKVPTYTLRHTNTHLKCMIAGNARRLEINKGKAVLS